MDLLFATRNRHKTREFAELLGREVRDLTNERELPEVVENGATFEENASCKALAIARVFSDLWVIADDSGLELDALCGAPGIHSARYAGENASDAANVAKLLRELDRETNRSARFVCVIALARAGEIIAQFRGTVEGRVAKSPRGIAGFGYDPVFVPDGHEMTFAEMSAAQKNAISHRANAARQLRKFLETRREI